MLNDLNGGKYPIISIHRLFSSYRKIFVITIRKRQISFDNDTKQPEKIEIAPGKSPHIISSPKKSEVHKALDNVLSSNIIEENEESSRDSAERVDRSSTETNCDSPSPVSSLSPSRRQSGADSFDSGCSSPTIKGRKRVKRKSRKQSNSTEEFSESPDFRSWNRKGICIIIKHRCHF